MSSHIEKWLYLEKKYRDGGFSVIRTERVLNELRVYIEAPGKSKRDVLNYAKDYYGQSILSKESKKGVWTFLVRE